MAEVVLAPGVEGYVTPGLDEGQVLSEQCLGRRVFHPAESLAETVQDVARVERRKYGVQSQDNFLPISRNEYCCTETAPRRRETSCGDVE